MKRTYEEFCFQQRVLSYRYSLHELMIREGLSAETADAVGTAPDEIYRGSFARYVRDRAPQFGLSDSAIEDFLRAASQRIQQKRFIALLRDFLARPLELLLLTDRALVLEEKVPPQMRVELLSIFDARLSPRNVAVICRAS